MEFRFLLREFHDGGCNKTGSPVREFNTTIDIYLFTYHGAWTELASVPYLEELAVSNIYYQLVLMKCLQDCIRQLDIYIVWDSLKNEVFFPSSQDKVRHFVEG